MSHHHRGKRQYRKKGLIECNGYKLQKLLKLGEGTYGIVYKVKDLKTKQIFAIKKIRCCGGGGGGGGGGGNTENNDIDDGEEGLSTTTIREIALLKELSSHKNIVKLYDILYDNKSPNTTFHLLFEFCDFDLKKYLNKYIDLDLEIIKKIMYQILDGISYCHNLHIFHRDLKPQNILINIKTLEIKIADFGLARTFSYGFIENKFGKDYTHEVITLWYRPPEILLGNDQYLPSIDIWSIGCIFAEIVNNSQPLFRGDSEICQLFYIFQVLGTIKNIKYYHNFNKLKYYNSKFPNWKSKPINQIVPKLKFCGQDLLKRMLKLNPISRCTAKQALKHPYFNNNNTSKTMS